MDVIVSLAKRRGFIFQSSEIYGGTGSCWDYGPLGVELKNNIKRVWWRDFVQQRGDMVGLDASILMHATVWKASGHVDNFTDPMVDCRECKRRFRADHVDELPWTHFCEATKGNKFQIPAGEACRHCGQRRTLCPECGKGQLTAPRQFNLMFKTFMGPVEEDASVTYLRPETAQGIFVNFDNVLQTTRRKLPFGIAQIGKAFRNEITPGNFIFRTREFEQMEIEFFVNPHERIDGRPADEDWHDRWIEDCQRWFERYGLDPAHLKRHEHAHDELAHYAKRTVDILYEFPMGWSELDGDRQPHRLRPQAAREVQRQVADVVRRGAQGARGAVRHRALGRAWTARCWPSCSTPTARRRSAARSARCCASIPSWPR